MIYLFSWPPVGVIVAALCIGLVGLLATASLKAERGPNYRVGCLLPCSMLAVALGLFWQARWAWWVMMALMIIAVMLNLWHLFKHENTPRALVRIVIIGAWVWYFTRPTIRAWFGI